MPLSGCIPVCKRITFRFRDSYGSGNFSSGIMVEGNGNVRRPVTGLMVMV